MARHFVRLKASLLASALRRGWQAALGFVAGLVFGLPLALAVGAGLAFASGTAAGPALLVLAYVGLAVGWTVAPVLFFGLDETLDPARLWLLPLSRRQLLVGLTAAGSVGLAPLATLLVLGAGLFHARGLASGAVAAVAVLLQLLVCLWAGRALATALSTTLRSRRGRDIGAAAMVLVGLAFAAAGQLPNLFLNILGDDAALGARAVALLDDVARVLTLTPPGWAAGAVLAAAEGQTLAAVGLLAAATALAAGLAWAWQAALARALSTPDGGSSGSGADTPLGPFGLRTRRPLTAAVAKELRYTVRVPQLRVGLGLLAVLGIGLVGAVVLFEPLAQPGIVLAPAGIALLHAFQSVNGFGYDRGALWLLVAGGTDHRADVAAKGIAGALVALALVLPLVLALAVVTGGWAQVPWAVAAAVAALAAAHGVGAVASVLAPHPMPEGATNLWGSSSGMGCATALMQFAAFAAQALLLMPAAGAVLAAWLLAPPLLPVALLVAVAYGVGIWWAGVAIAASRLRARGPEIVAALSATTDR